MSFIYRQSDPKWFRMYVMNPPPPPLRKGETPQYQEYIISYLSGDENGLWLFLHYYESRVLNNRIIAFIDSNSLPTSAFQDLKQEFMEMLWIELGKYSADEEYSFCYWLKKDYIRVFNEYYLRNHANAGGMDVRTFEKYKAIYAKWRSNLLSDEPLSLEDFLAENNITERMWRNMLLRLSFISLGVKPRMKNDENDEEEQLSAEEMLTAGRGITVLMQEVEDEYAKAIDDLREDDIEVHLLCKNLEIYKTDDAIKNGVYSELEVNDNVYVYGNIANNELLKCKGQIVKISKEDYSKYLKGVFRITFDATGGTSSSSEITVMYGSKYGNLPTATRTGFMFDGWYTANGDKITSDTTVAVGSDITLYAHWTVNNYTATWNTGTGYSISVSRTKSPNQKATIGEISSGAKIYYGDVLSITYTKADYYTIETKGKTSITVTGDVTSTDIFATATLNPLSDWVKESDVPAGAKTEQTKYSYREYYASSSSSVAGWTQYGTPQITSWSDWSSWVTWDPSNGVRNVEHVAPQYDHTEYHYYRWINSAGTMYDYQYSKSYWLEEKWFSYVLPIVPGNTYLSYEGTNKSSNWWQQAKSPNNYSVDSTWSRDIYTEEKWRYQEPIYTYYFYRDSESSSYPTGNVDMIQKWVKYRAK